MVTDTLKYLQAFFFPLLCKQWLINLHLVSYDIFDLLISGLENCKLEFHLPLCACSWECPTWLAVWCQRQAWVLPFLQSQGATCRAIRFWSEPSELVLDVARRMLAPVVRVKPDGIGLDWLKVRTWGWALLASSSFVGGRPLVLMTAVPCPSSLADSKFTFLWSLRV
jgi:hypothetical protein